MPKPLAEVYHLDLFGLRKDKYQTLLDNSIASLPWKKIDCRAPNYFFIAKDFDILEQYEQGFSVNELFPVNSSGIKTHRDDFVIDMDKNALSTRIENFYSSSATSQELKNKFTLKETEQWISSKRQATFNSNCIKQILYRPFDNRHIYYSSDLIERGREKVMQHFIKGENTGFIVTRQLSTFKFQHPFVTNKIIDGNMISLQTKEYGYVYPLYLYPENITQQLLETPVRTPNLNPEILQKIAEKLGLAFVPEVGEIPCARPLYCNEPGQPGQPQGIAPTIDESGQPQVLAPTVDKNLGAPLVGAFAFAPIDLLDYIYAVLHSPNYRETYKEFLKIDFPRVPYPDPQTFWPLVKLGAELRRLHLLGGEGSIPSAALPTSLWVESTVLDNLITTYPNDGDNIVTRKINKNDFEIMDSTGKSASTGRIWINDRQYFDDVPAVAWEFYIGGYQPAQKWLKDRHGRKLNFEDIVHYQKIIVALTETHRIMKEIDSILPRVD